MMQAMRHIQVSESASVSYINKKKLAGGSLAESGLKAKIVLKLIDYAFRSGLKFKAPSVLQNPTDSTLADLINDWDSTRGEMKKLIEDYPRMGIESCLSTPDCRNVKYY